MRPSIFLNSNQPTGPNWFDRLSEKLILQVFSYLDKKYLLLIANVCKRWNELVKDPKLWTDVSFRPETGGIELENADLFAHTIGNRFSQMKRLDLPTELITPNVLRELAMKCPNLYSLTLDFSSAMQLHEFNDLNAFPSHLTYLCIFLSDVIFMEGFMRKIYSYLTSIEIFHLIGTYERTENREEDESYEVINIHKIKSHTPNLRVVNFYGIKFLEDSHIEALSTNCIQLECLSLDFCTNFKGSSLKILFKRCKKLKCLLLERTGLTNENVKAAPWELMAIQELDISSTELNGHTVAFILTKLRHHLNFLSASNLERLMDEDVEPLVEKNVFQNIRTINLSWCQNLTESMLTKLVKKIGPNLTGLDISGLYDLSETFWSTILPSLKICKILIIGIPKMCCVKIHSKILIDKYVEIIAQSCPDMEELEIQWDSNTLRFSERSNKFIDHLRTKCIYLKSFVLTEGEYYEMVKSNFERADRNYIVRSKTNYITSVLPLLKNFNDLCFT